MCSVADATIREQRGVYIDDIFITIIMLPPRHDKIAFAVMGLRVILVLSHDGIVEPSYYMKLFQPSLSGGIFYIAGG